jgi:hypothetical protein
MTEQLCECGRPTAGSYLCPQCIKTLDVALGNIPGYYDDLETLRTKQTRYVSERTKGSIGKSQPLGMDLRFVRAGLGSEVDYAARNTLTTWVRLVMDEQPPLSGPYCAHSCLHVSCGATFRRRAPKYDTVRSMCAYLQRQLSFVVRERWAAEVLDEITDVEARLARLIDRPADRWYAGKCSIEGEDGDVCEAEIYALKTRGKAKCHRCGYEHDIESRRDYLLREARNVNVTATEAAGALLAWTDYGGSEEKLVDRIRKWATTEYHPDGTVKRVARLETHGSIQHLGRDRSLYKLGEIEKLLIESAQHDQKRRMTGAA